MHLRISRELHAKLKIMAWDHAKPMSKLAGRLLRTHVEEYFKTRGSEEEMRQQREVTLKLMHGKTRSIIDAVTDDKGGNAKTES